MRWHLIKNFLEKVGWGKVINEVERTVPDESSLRQGDASQFLISFIIRAVY
jgi:hypothetical protein